jgi:hypothetical protein
MKNLTQIKKELRRGDFLLCHDITKYTTDYIKKVVAGDRINENIVFVLGEIVQNRKDLFKRLKSFNYKTQK